MAISPKQAADLSSMFVRDFCNKIEKEIDECLNKCYFRNPDGSGVFVFALEDRISIMLDDFNVTIDTNNKIRKEIVRRYEKTWDKVSLDEKRLILSEVCKSHNSK